MLHIIATCSNKEIKGLTASVLVSRVTVDFSWRGFNDQLHCLDLVLSADETPRHRTTVSGGLWHFDIILKCKVKPRGQREDIYVGHLAKSATPSG